MTIIFTILYFYFCIYNRYTDIYFAGVADGATSPLVKTIRLHHLTYHR